MTVLDAMKTSALGEFDRLVAEKEREIRFQMKAAGASQFEIRAYLESCRPGLADQRAQIGSLVTVELMKAGVPLELGVNDNVRA